jgi:hypothetical protein
MEIQLRFKDGAIKNVGSVREAFDIASADFNVEKVSWFENGKNIRFVRDRTEPGNPWYYEPMDTMLDDLKRDLKGKKHFTW